MRTDALANPHISMEDINFSLLGGIGLEKKISMHKALFVELRYENSGELLVVHGGNGNTHASARYLSFTGGLKF